MIRIIPDSKCNYQITSTANQYFNIFGWQKNKIKLVIHSNITMEVLDYINTTQTFVN